MGTLRSRTEKQVYEYTVLTFNKLFGFLQTKTEFTSQDWDFMGGRLVRLYQVWSVLWGKRQQRADRITTWKRAADWVQNSGILNHIQPLIMAKEGEKGQVLWNLATSDEFLRWSLRQLAEKA